MNNKPINKRTRGDLLKEIQRLKKQRSKIKTQMEEIRNAGDAFVYYVTGLKVNP